MPALATDAETIGSDQHLTLPSLALHKLLSFGDVSEVLISGSLSAAAPWSRSHPLLRVSYSTSVQPETTIDLCMECGAELHSHVSEGGRK